MFKNLVNELKKESETRIEKMTGYINNYDDSLRNYSTETRWNQYQTGEITKNDAINYAIKRMTKKEKKELDKKISDLERIATADDLKNIEISIEWKKSYYGNNPKATVLINGKEEHTEKAGGWGYDKESAAVGSALNDSDIVLKALYSFKESQLKNGLNNEYDNRNLMGYGSGYGVLPYFEGGVGVDCFWNIFEKMGYKTHGFFAAKTTDYYTITKES